MGQNGQQIQKQGESRPDTVKTVQSMLTKHKGQLQAALPKHVTADRMIRIALTSIRRTPKLQEVPPTTLIGCIMSASQLGLEIDNGLGHAYIVPFKNKGKPDAQLIIGYKGLVELARRSAQISTIYAHVVHEDDEFDYELGLEPRLTHKPSGQPIPAKMDEATKSITRAYAVARMKDGGVQFDSMSTQEIEAIRARSKAGNSGPWITDWPEMAKKTVLRRLSKLLPMAIEYQRAVARDEQIDVGIAYDFSAETPGDGGDDDGVPGAIDVPTDTASQDGGSGAEEPTPDPEPDGGEAESKPIAIRWGEHKGTPLRYASDAAVKTYLDEVDAHVNEGAEDLLPHLQEVEAELKRRQGKQS